MPAARNLSIIAFAVLALLPAHADEAADRKAVEESFQKNLAALKRQDVTALKALRTADYVMIYPDGKREGLSVFAQNMKTQFKEGVKVTGGILKIEKMAPGPKELEAVTRITFTLAATDPQRKPHTMEQSAHNRVIFLRTPGGLKIKKSILLEEPAMKLDGKPYPPKPET